MAPDRGFEEIDLSGGYWSPKLCDFVLLLPEAGNEGKTIHCGFL